MLYGTKTTFARSNANMFLVKKKYALLFLRPLFEMMPCLRTSKSKSERNRLLEHLMTTDNAIFFQDDNSSKQREQQESSPFYEHLCKSICGNTTNEVLRYTNYGQKRLQSKVTTCSFCELVCQYTLLTSTSLKARIAMHLSTCLKK